MNVYTYIHTYLHVTLVITLRLGNGRPCKLFHGVTTAYVLRVWVGGDSGENKKLIPSPPNIKPPRNHGLVRISYRLDLFGTIQWWGLILMGMGLCYIKKSRNISVFNSCTEQLRIQSFCKLHPVIVPLHRFVCCIHVRWPWSLQTADVRLDTQKVWFQPPLTSEQTLRSSSNFEPIKQWLPAGFLRATIYDNLCTFLQAKSNNFCRFNPHCLLLNHAASMLWVVKDSSSASVSEQHDVGNGLSPGIWQPFGWQGWVVFILHLSSDDIHEPIRRVPETEGWWRFFGLSDCFKQKKKKLEKLVAKEQRKARLQDGPSLQQSIYVFSHAVCTEMFSREQLDKISRPLLWLKKKVCLWT